MSAFDPHSKIIVGVDDNAANLLYLKTTLVAAGYNFIGAVSGAECLGLVLRAQANLILLDIQMPGLDGFETCRRLRAMREMATTPITFLTASKTRDDVRQGMAAGGNDFIIKPFDAARLLDRVQHWSSRRVEQRTPTKPVATPAA